MTDKPSLRNPDFVWIVGNMDYGDNGWTIERVFITRPEAEQFVIDHPQRFGYWEVQKHHVGDIGGDLYGSREYEPDAR